jgi:hypothetical protein
MPSWLNELVVTLLGTIAVWILKRPTRAERAALLRHLADDAAASLLALRPGATLEDLVHELTTRLKAESSVPTDNSLVIERAAQAALVRLGKTPSMP